MSGKMTLGEEVLGKLSIDHLLKKAASTDVIQTSEVANSILSRQQADRFIDLVVDTSSLLKAIRVARIDHPSGEINKLDLGHIVTESARATGVATHKPTASKIEYDTEKIRSAFDITSDFTEDNLEGPSVRDKLLTMFTKRIAIDVEILALEGDDDVVPVSGSATELKDRLIMSNDGFIKILEANVPAAQQIDAAGCAPSTALFYKMKRAVPQRYRVAKPDYRWVVNSATWDKWNFDMTKVGAADQGGTPNDTIARFRESTGGGSPLGQAMVEVPLMPEDLTYTTPDGTDGTSIWSTPLMNLIVFIQRDITIEWDRVPREDKWEVTIHSRNDFNIENRDMCVIANDVGIDGADYILP